ncbi:aminodeoxychorismate synthase component I, partial [Cereibacter sphaeroides]|nr:aminodeoxychorismate synthase component I [Cereibacter sphaeroides]
MILCENGPAGGPALFRDAVETVIVRDPAAVAPALSRLDALRAAGLWVAGAIGYEAGLVFEPRLASLMPRDRDEPLLAFGAYAAPGDAAPLLAQAEAEAGAARLG